MNMNGTLKRLLVACHPDRHGGDHSMMERFYSAMRRPSQAMDAIRRCVHCGVRIGGVKTCQTHRYVRRAIAMVFIAATSFAGDVRLAWDASTSAGVTNYVLYAHTNSLSATNLASATIKVNAGTNLTARIEGMASGTTWYFVATAVAGGVQSDPSNQVVVQVPAPPGNSRVVAVQWGVSLDSITNNQFFRLYFP